MGTLWSWRGFRLQAIRRYGPAVPEAAAKAGRNEAGRNRVFEIARYWGRSGKTVLHHDAEGERKCAGIPVLRRKRAARVCEVPEHKNTTARETKNGRKRAAKPILFGMAQCRNSTGWVITEGQIDSPTLSECGIENAVSVPTGALGFTWFPNCLGMDFSV